MNANHGRMAKGGHGLPKALPGPAMPNPLHPAGRPPMKQPQGSFRGSPLAGQAAYGHLLPLRTLHAVYASDDNLNNHLFLTFLHVKELDKTPSRGSDKGPFSAPVVPVRAREDRGWSS
jgi:hypothetical protein